MSVSAPDAVRAMLGARSVAVVGASPRPGTFGERLVTEVLRSPARPKVSLVNPRYAEVAGHPCHGSLADLSAPVDLVLLGVPDAALDEQLQLAAARGDRSAVVFGAAWSPPAPGPTLRERLAQRAQAAGMALCGGGCMGFVDVTGGLRAIGYLENEDLPAGPVALVSHSGSAFSALLRSRRQIGWTLAVSSGQELVTTTADYLEHALDRTETKVVALLLETLREVPRLHEVLDRARDQDVPVVLLAVGGTPPASALVAAHSGALAGAEATWEALTERHGLLRVDDLDEMVDLLELLAAGRRATVRGVGSGVATLHDSGAERVLTADIAHRAGVPFATLSASTEQRLGALLDPGLEVANPLDVWGTGDDTRELFANCLTALADDPAVAAVALAVDLVEEYDGDDSYPLAALDAAGATSKPLVVLSHLISAVDPVWAQQLRAAGVPVLEGTRSGLHALGHLLALAEPWQRAAAPPLDEARRERWLARLGRGPLSAVESFALLRDYGVTTVNIAPASSRAEALLHAERVGYPVVLKTDEGVAHKSDVGGVVLGLTDAGQVVAAYDDLATRIGPRVLVCSSAAPGVEMALGVTHDPLLGPLVVVGAGGLLVEVLADRAVAVPPLDRARTTRLVDGLRVAALLGGVRGGPAADVDALVDAVCGVSVLAAELGSAVAAVDVNPLVVSPTGARAVDVLVLSS
jgi:acetate---CoA ligase (ADP-forming)